MKSLLVVAHRGGKGPYRENTLDAFMHAFNSGVSAVEMDIRLDHFHDRFYLEHDLIHRPKRRRNTLDGIVPGLPKETTIFVELKTFAWLTGCFARRFLKTYKERFVPRNTLVISFNPFVLIQLRKLDPEMRLGILMGTPYWLFLFKTVLRKRMMPDVFLLHKRLFTYKNVEYGKEKGMKIWSFVLNKEKEWKKALAYGIDGITTDHPTALLEYIEEQQKDS